MFSKIPRTTPTSGSFQNGPSQSSNRNGEQARHDSTTLGLPLNKLTERDIVPSRSNSTDNGGFTPFCLADRPNHVNILAQAATETAGFGVLTQATVSETVEDLIAKVDAPVIVDCSAFAEGEFEGTLIELFDTYEQMNADYGLIPDKIGARLETDDSVALATRLWERGHPRWSFEPIPVAQGSTPAEYAAAYWDCYQMGADHIAIGGLLTTDGNRSGGHATGVTNLFEVLQAIKQANPRLWPNTWTFALGCDHPRRRPRFRSLGVQAADSKRWLFQYDDSLPASRETQLVTEIVQSTTHHTPTLEQAVQRPSE
jgi:hypothetical protein